jgi:EAL domain-containing protein (putative c-di-GMP-specific phosphodiesterase class I)
MQDVVTTGLFIFEPDGQAAPYGFAIPGLEDAPMRRIPRRRTDYLRERAGRGPWIEAWESRPWHPYEEVFRLLGVRAVAYAPVRDGDNVIGFIHISSASPQAEERLSDALPALVEFAEIAGAIIGPSVAARGEVGDSRRRIQAMIDEQRFSIAFQPIVDLRRDEIVGYEALARFHDGVAPDARFAEAEAVGIGPELEIATIRTALELAEQLPAGPWLNVNVSPARVLDADGALAALVSPCSRPIVLEVTEHAAIADYIEFRQAVARLGPCVRIAVDDAGAGFSSLRHILEVRPAFVKLDRALIAGLDADEARRALVAGLRHFANGARCRLIAEGVETVDELAALRQLDVALGQGYLLGRPTEIGVDQGADAEPVRSARRMLSARRDHSPASAAAAASASSRSSALT